MGNHPVESLVYTALKNLEEIVDVNKIVGNPIKTPSGDIIITVSKVGFGFAAGGTQFGNNVVDNVYPFGGGSGGGVSITPVAFLVINKEGVSVKHLSDQAHLLDKIIDKTPQVMEKIKGMIGKKENSQN